MHFSQHQLKKALALGHKRKTRACAKLAVGSEETNPDGSELAFTNTCAFHKWRVFFFIVCVRVNANIVGCAATRGVSTPLHSH